MLHAMETKGYLRSIELRQGERSRRLYRITPSGKMALRRAKRKVQELFGELFEVAIGGGKRDSGRRISRT